MNKKYYELIDETLYSFVCDNGLEVFLLNKKDYYKTYGIFVTKFGSTHSSFTSNGISYDVIDGAAHFLEHKMFEKHNYDVMEIFAKQSASSNAFTSFDKTAYLFTATNNVSQNIETLLDFVQDLELSDESVEKEKPIIASEIAMYDDDVEWQAFFSSLQTLYHNNSVKIDIAGTKDTIYNITKEDLYNYYDHFYHPSNMTLFICGNFDLLKIEKVIKENQARKKFKKITFNLNKVEEPKEVVTPYLIKYMDLVKSKYVLSFKVSDYIYSPIKQEITMGFLLDILFGKSSELYLDLISKQIIDSNYTYSYNQDHQQNYAFIQLSFTCSDEEALKLYLDNYFKQDLSLKIDETQFKCIKARYLGEFIRMFNSVEQIANGFISYKVLGFDLFSIIDDIQKIEYHDLKKLLVLFNLDYSTTTVIRPQKNFD